MTSVTLIPNVYAFPEETLIDMPGLEDKRDFKGVLGVSYMFKGVFELVQKCRFIFLISEKSFDVRERLLKMTQQFLQFINFSSLDQQERKIFLNSVVLVITKANWKGSEYAQQLKSVAQDIQKQSYRGSVMKKQILQFFQYISQNQEKVFTFEMAKLGEDAPQCSFIQNYLNDQNWSYFPIKQLEQKKNIIHLPFSKNFKNLQEYEQNQFTNHIMLIIDGFEDLQKIIKTFIREGIQNLSFQKTQNHQLLELSEKFVKKFMIDVSDSQEAKRLTIIDNPNDIFLKKNNQNKFIPVIGIQLAQNIFQTCCVLVERMPSFSENLQQNQDQKDKVMIFLKQIRTAIKKIYEFMIQSSCCHLTQYNILTDCLFIILRHYRQISMFSSIVNQNQLQLSITHDCLDRLRDSLNQIVNQFGHSLTEVFLNIYQKLIVIDDAKKQNELVQIITQNKKNEHISQSLFLQYFNFQSFIKSLNEIQSCTMAYRYLIFLFKNIQMHQIMHQQNFALRVIWVLKKALKSSQKQTTHKKIILHVLYLKFISSIRSQANLQKQLSQKRQQEKKAFQSRIKNQIFVNLIKLGKLLTSIKMFDIAIQIFNLTGNIDFCCDVYKKMIFQSQIKSNEHQLTKIMKGYAKFCCENCKILEGRNIYQQIYSLESLCYQQRMEIVQLQQATFQQVVIFQNIYKKNLLRLKNQNYTHQIVNNLISLKYFLQDQRFISQLEQLRYSINDEQNQMMKHTQNQQLLNVNICNSTIQESYYKSFETSTGQSCQKESTVHKTTKSQLSQLFDKHLLFYTLRQIFHETEHITQIGNDLLRNLLSYENLSALNEEEFDRILSQNQKIG